MNKYYYKWRSKVIAYLGGICSKCGADKNLEIHHKNPKEKAFSLAKFWSYKWNEILSEIQKCTLLCFDCHKLEHSAKHGSLGMYKHHKCRCDLCKTAHNTRSKVWKKTYRARLRLGVTGST